MKVVGANEGSVILNLQLKYNTKLSNPSNASSVFKQALFNPKMVNSRVMNYLKLIRDDTDIRSSPVGNNNPPTTGHSSTMTTAKLTVIIVSAVLGVGAFMDIIKLT